MKNLKSTWVAVAAISVLLLGAAGVLQAQESNQFRREFHQTYNLNPTGEVSLENINGNVQITGWDRNEVKVDAVISAASQDTLDHIKVSVNSSPGAIEIKTDFPHGSFNHHGNWRVNYVLMAPRRAAIDKLDLVNGSIELSDMLGDVRASSVNGSIHARDLSGAVHLSAVNGPVEASFANGELSSPVSASSVNGPITIILPSGVHADVSASTVNGSIDNNFGIQVTGRLVGHSLHGTIGNGGVEIRLSSVNGPIHIRSSSQEVE